MGDRWLRGKVKGITGLETAIILIAFVIVASVFAFAVMNMGLLTTQKAGSTVESGMKQASSALQLAGSVIAYDGLYDGSTFNTSSGNENKADAIEIYVKLAPGNEPISISNMTISYTNKRVHVGDLVSLNNTQDQATYPLIVFKWIGADNDSLLESNEVLAIIINVGNVTGIDTVGSSSGSDGALGPNEWFKVEIKPPVGAVLSVERTLPAAIDSVMDLG